MARRSSPPQAGFLSVLGPDLVSRVLVPAAIVLFWGGMMAHLVTHEIVPSYQRAQHTLVDPDILLGQWQTIQEWAWIEHHDAHAGATSLVIEKRADSAAKGRWIGYALKQNTYVNVTLPGASAIPVTVRIRIDLTPEFHVEAFAAQVTGQGIGLQCQGFIQTGRLYYRLTDVGAFRAGGETDSWTYGHMDVGDEPLDLSDAIRPLLARHGSVRVGDKYAVRVFSPLGDLAAQDAQVLVAGQDTLMVDRQPVVALRLETTVNGFPPLKSWVDPSGVTLRRELILGYTTQRGGAVAIREAYPALGTDLPMPVLNRNDFVQRAEATGAGSGEPTGDEQTLGLIGAFLRTL